MSQILKHPVFRNWHLKLFSLILATMLWATVASDPTSEIGISVPIQYQNMPARHQVLGDTSTRVEIRLRGPSSLLKGLSPQDVAIAIDLSRIQVEEEKILPLTAEHIRAPFGVEVVRVIPARVQVVLEPTISKTVRIRAEVRGEPRSGFEVQTITVNPRSIDVEGPRSHVREVQELSTSPVDVSGKRESFSQTVDLDVPDPYISVPKDASVEVEVRIRRN
jgi:YbbR domain-containing protein